MIDMVTATREYQEQLIKFATDQARTLTELHLSSWKRFSEITQEFVNQNPTIFWNSKK